MSTPRQLPDRLLTIAQVCERLALRRETLWRLRRDRQAGFPQARKILPGLRGQRFSSREVELWIETRPTC